MAYDASRRRVIDFDALCVHQHLHHGGADIRERNIATGHGKGGGIHNQISEPRTHGVFVAEDALKSRLHRLKIEQRFIDVEDDQGKSGQIRNLRFASSLHVAPESLGARGQEKRIVLPPHCQKGWLVAPEISLEGWVERDVALAVAEQIQLHLIGAGPGKVEVVERVSVRRNSRRIGRAVRVLPDGGLGFEEGTHGVAVGGRRVLPIGSFKGAIERRHVVLKRSQRKWRGQYIEAARRQRRDAGELRGVVNACAWAK
jgi:hypothetical protein